MPVASTDECAFIRSSDLFDADWYRATYPDVAMTGMDPAEHYLWLGARLGRDPSPAFSTRAYLMANADVAAAGRNPLLHFIQQGRLEGRKAASAAELAPWMPPQRTYVERSEQPLPETLPARLVAFYLPQFHPIPENDAWWGEGFTEWTNVAPAQPQFVGHYQPHVPHPDVGMYDLRDPAVQQRQIEMAKAYGIGAFCFYYYRFHGHRLLETPIENWLADPTLDFPFCLCWANENWSRRWDGLESEILMAQEHSPQDDIGCIADLARYLRDPRYLRIDGKPVVLIYRPSLLPDTAATAARWRAWCRENGVGEIFLAYTQSFEKVDPAIYGFDAAIEFPPNNSAPPDLTARIAPLSADYGGKVYDWSIFPERSRNYREESYRLFRSVCPAWDNTARRKQNGTTFVNDSPALYREWLENALQDTVRRSPTADERLVFINAWNEWAEGAHLEPDQANGYAYLDATRQALVNTAAKMPESSRRIVVVSHDAWRHGAQYLSLNLARTLAKDFGYTVDMVVLGDGPLKADFAKWATVHDLAGVDRRGEQAQQLVRHLRALGAETAICNTSVSGVFAGTLKDTGFKVVSLIHELPKVLEQYDLGEAARTILDKADAVVFAADAVAEGFAAFTGRAPRHQLIRPQGLYKTNRLRRQPGGLDHARIALRQRHGIAPDAPVILCVGYADWRKGIDLFVAAGTDLLKQRPDARFIWLGLPAEPQWMEQAKACAVEAGLIDRFIFPGLEEETDVYYAGADVYALTSREDPYPSVVLEALDCGLPVIAFEKTGGMDALISEAGGLLVPQFDTAAYAAALERALSDRTLRAKAAGTGPSLIDRHYAFRQYVHDLLVLGGEDIPRVSVIVPNYNYARYIEARLESCVRQSVPVYELIVLDDLSPDDSVARIERFLSTCQVPATLTVNTVNSGSVFRQWLRGVEMARGDYVWIAEADDLADSDLLASLLPAFADPDVVMSYCESRQIDGEGALLADNYLDYVAEIDADRWKAAYVVSGTEEIGKALYLKNTIPNASAVLFRRDALLAMLREHGDEVMSYRNAGDWVAYIRLLERGSIAFCPRAMNAHRRHQGSVTIGNANERHLQEIARVQTETIVRHRLGQGQPEKARAYLEKVARQFGLPVEAAGPARTAHTRIDEIVA